MIPFKKDQLVTHKLGFSSPGRHRVMRVVQVHLDTIIGQSYDTTYVKSGQVQHKIPHNQLVPWAPPATGPDVSPGAATVPSDQLDVDWSSEPTWLSQNSSKACYRLADQASTVDVNQLEFSSDPDFDSQGTSTACFLDPTLHSAPSSATVSPTPTHGDLGSAKERLLLEGEERNVSYHMEMVAQSKIGHMFCPSNKDLSGLEVEVSETPLSAPSTAAVSSPAPTPGHQVTGTSDSLLSSGKEQVLVEAKEESMLGLTNSSEHPAHANNLEFSKQSSGVILSCPPPKSKVLTDSETLSIEQCLDIVDGKEEDMTKVEGVMETMMNKAEELQMGQVPSDSQLIVQQLMPSLGASTCAPQSPALPVESKTSIHDQTLAVATAQDVPITMPPGPNSQALLITKDPKPRATQTNTLRQGLVAARQACVEAGSELPLGEDLERSSTYPACSPDLLCDKENNDPKAPTLAQLLKSVSAPVRPTHPNISKLSRQGRSRQFGNRSPVSCSKVGQHDSAVPNVSLTSPDEPDLDSSLLKLAQSVNVHPAQDDLDLSMVSGEDSEFSDPFHSSKLPKKKILTKKKQKISTGGKPSTSVTPPTCVRPSPCAKLSTSVQCPIPVLTDGEDSDDEEFLDTVPLRRLKPLPTSSDLPLPTRPVLPPLPARKKTKRSKPGDRDSVTPAKRAKPAGATTNNNPPSKPKQTVRKAPKFKYSENDIPTNPLNFKMTNGAGEEVEFGTSEFNHLFGESEKMTDATKKSYNLEFDRFLRFVRNNFGEGKETDLLSSTLPPTECSDIVSTFIQSRINVKEWRDHGVRKFLDTSTMDLIWQKIVAVFKQKTTYNLWSDDFVSARNARATYMVNSKKVHGHGELQNQPEALTRAMISFLLHSDQVTMFTPRGLVWNFYLLFTLIFLPRVRTEAKQVTRGDFFFLRNSDGSVRAVVYCPKGQLKRDRGHIRGDHHAKVFKRPIALPCPGEPKLSFDIVLETMFAHLDKLPWNGPRSEQPMFYQVVQQIPKPGSCFFLNRQMGVDYFSRLFRTLIWSTGLKVSALQYQNQSLRPSAFSFHQLLGLSTGQFMATAGHASSRTHIIYTRRNIELKAQAAGNFQEFIGQVPVEMPDLTMVEIEDRLTGRTEIRQVRDFLPILVRGQQQGLFPISGMTAREIKTHLPELEWVDDEDDDLGDNTLILEIDPEAELTAEVPQAGVFGLDVSNQHGLGQGADIQCPSSRATRQITTATYRTPGARSSNQLYDQRPTSAPASYSSAKVARPASTTRSDRSSKAAQQFAPAESCSAPRPPSTHFSPSNVARPTSSNRIDHSPMTAQQLAPPGSTSTPRTCSGDRSRFSFKNPRIQLTERLPATSLAFQSTSPSDMSVLDLSCPRR